MRQNGQIRKSITNSIEKSFKSNRFPCSIDQFVIWDLFLHQNCSLNARFPSKNIEWDLGTHRTPTLLSRHQILRSLGVRSVKLQLVNSWIDGLPRYKKNIHNTGYSWWLSHPSEILGKMCSSSPRIRVENRTCLKPPTKHQLRSNHQVA